VIEPDTAAALDRYRRFRHVFRNAYGVALEWDRIAPKADGVRATWARLDADVQRFVGLLRATASPGDARGAETPGPRTDSGQDPS